ncbi:hypothetical protein [Herbiconiux liukaitaii]|uniref:hypothetical protein n=1 Tax=Herbiconiux liukaitaii TaxID=3342799 RepID=UPI0035B7DE99
MLLYDWNTEISAAFWESLAYLEVALRNALDNRMTQMHAAKGRPGHWIFDDARELGRDGRGPNRHKYPYEDIATAIRRVRTNRQPVDPGQIISEISFGFWHQMVSSRQRFLWPDLVAAFPGSPDRRQSTVHDPIAGLRAFRNRIGHHHRIWSLDIPARYADLLTVAGYLDVDLPGWIDTRSRVTAVLAARGGSRVGYCACSWPGDWP